MSHCISELLFHLLHIFVIYFLHTAFFLYYYIERVSVTQQRHMSIHRSYRSLQNTGTQGFRHVTVGLSLCKSQARHQPSFLRCSKGTSTALSLQKGSFPRLFFVARTSSSSLHTTNAKFQGLPSSCFSFNTMLLPPPLLIWSQIFVVCRFRRQFKCQALSSFLSRHIMLFSIYTYI